MSWFSDFFKSEEPSLETVSTQTKQQQEMMKKFGDWMYEGIGGFGQQWEGGFAAPPSEYEEMGLEQLGKYVGGDMGEVGEFGLGQYMESLKGLDPEYMEGMYREHILPRQQRIFREEVIPTIRESYVGPGTFYGSGRTEREAKAGETFGEFTGGQMFDYIQKGQEYGRQSLGMLPEMTRLQDEDPLRRAAAGLTYGALPRQIEQKELEGRISEFIRTLPENSPMIPYLMQYMDMSTQAAFMKPGSPSPFAEVLGMAGDVASLFSGFGFGSEKKKPTFEQEA